MPAHDGRTPVSSIQAVIRMEHVLYEKMPYRLGSGDYSVGSHGTPGDVPWTADRHGVVGCDCAGVLLYAYELQRHQVGFNRPLRPRGYWDILDVVDDMNTNSMIGDARDGGHQYFVEVPIGDDIEPGDMLVYPTIRLPNATKSDWLRDANGVVLEWIGHGQLVRFGHGAKAGGPYSVVTVMQCYGPNDRIPAVRQTDASVMDNHDHRWPRPEHRTTVIRINPRCYAPHVGSIVRTSTKS